MDSGADQRDAEVLLEKLILDVQTKPRGPLKAAGGKGVTEVVLRAVQGHLMTKESGSGVGEAKVTYRDCATGKGDRDLAREGAPPARGRLSHGEGLWDPHCEGQEP